MNPWDNPVASPSYAAPLVDFSALGNLLSPSKGQQGQQNPNEPLSLDPNQNQKQGFSLLNPNPNGLAARLMAYLNPPVNAGNQGGTAGNMGGIY